MKSEIFDSATGTFSDSVDVPFEGHGGTAVQLGPTRIGVICLGHYTYSTRVMQYGTEVCRAQIDCVLFFRLLTISLNFGDATYCT